ncbi:hypothetical protein HDU96_010096 [Phlyctochytrium bullatum]|nr:hypothetical protein HDU96_010096 [Phlyctochytrium bullatum]
MRVDTILAATTAFLLASTGPTAAGPLVRRGNDGIAVVPASPAVGAAVAPAYFGPAPSSVNPALVGPVQLLKSASETNVENGTVTIPLYSAKHPNGKTYYFIVTDTTDKTQAEALGLNHSVKLQFAAAADNDKKGAVEEVTLNGDFEVAGRKGYVDFSGERKVVPGEKAPFPPKEFNPPSEGKDDYTPLIQVKNLGGVIFNAPIIAEDVSAEDLNAYCDGIPSTQASKARKMLHGKVVRICPKTETVTLTLTFGFSFAKPVVYLSTEASDPLAAALEDATFTPALGRARVGGDDSLFSPVERLFAVTNGLTNRDLPAGGPRNATVHPLRSGFASAVLGEGGPLNVLGGIPFVATDYSPLWDVNLGTWTDFAVKNHLRTRWLEEFQVLGFAAQGYVTKPDGSPFGSSGIVVNCPPVRRLFPLRTPPPPSAPRSSPSSSPRSAPLPPL